MNRHDVVIRFLPPSVAAGLERSPWTIEPEGVELLENGMRVFYPDCDFEFVRGGEVVADARRAGFAGSAADWENWLRDYSLSLQPQGLPNMGRKRKSDGGTATVEKKRKAVKTRRIAREHAGKVVEPYNILEGLIESVEQFEPLAEARFVMCYQKGWRPDADGILIRAKIKKASDLDKELGKEFDFAILLNDDLWNATKITDEAKEIDIFHELCHAAPEMDRDGEQKKDDRGRFCWRLRKHVIQEFPEVITRYGLKKIVGLNAAAIAALDDVKAREEAAKDKADGPGKRPLIEAAEKNAAAAPTAATKGDAKPADGADAWKLHKLAVLKGKLTEKAFDALEATHLKTLGELQAKMNQHGQFWAKELGVHGRHSTAIEDAFNQYLMAQQ